MKIRTGFVGNSSSSSFVIVNKNGNKKRVTTNMFFDEIFDKIQEDNEKELESNRDDEYFDLFLESYNYVKNVDKDEISVYSNGKYGVEFDGGKRRYFHDKPVYATVSDGNGKMSYIFRYYLLDHDEFETENFYIKLLDDYS